jgi:hypothetical protein
MRPVRLAVVAAVVCAALTFPAAALAQSPGRPASSGARRSATTQGGVTNVPRAPATNTGPGIGEPAVHDAVPGRTVRGLILFGIAAAIVVWLARARVRDWMLGPLKR